MLFSFWDFNIKCPKATSKSFTREIWLYDQTDFVRFNQMLTDINWNEKLCNFNDVDDMCEEFSKTFLFNECNCCIVVAYMSWYFKYIRIITVQGIA
jgi:hypothetical protein